MTKRHSVLVTGANGFVGRHMTRYLQEVNVDCIATGRSSKGADTRHQLPYYSCDLLQLEQVQQMISTIQPTCIIHLAGDTSLTEARKHPTEVIYNNVLATINLLESAKCIAPAPHVVVIGSAQEYAPPHTNESCCLPYTETSPTLPGNPYGWSKYLQTLVCRYHASIHLYPLTIARTFNLIGPGATKGVCAKIASSIVRMEHGEMDLVLTLGPTHIQRDFLDVRDAVSAYWNLAVRVPCVTGEIFNVCSGAATPLSNLVALFRDISCVPFSVVEDIALARPEETEIVWGSTRKLQEVTGWSPKYALKQTVEDIMTDCRTRHTHTTAEH